MFREESWLFILVHRVLYPFDSLFSKDRVSVLLGLPGVCKESNMHGIKMPLSLPRLYPMTYIHVDSPHKGYVRLAYKLQVYDEAVNKQEAFGCSAFTSLHLLRPIHERAVGGVGVRIKHSAHAPSLVQWIQALPSWRYDDWPLLDLKYVYFMCSRHKQRRTVACKVHLL